MDSMTAEKAQWLRANMFLVEDCFNKLIEKSFHQDNIQKNDKEKFMSLYESIIKTLDTYQRCKVGSLCRYFDELSTLFSNAYRSSSVDNPLKFKIKHTVIPIFSVIDQAIDLRENDLPKNLFPVNFERESINTV